MLSVLLDGMLKLSDWLVGLMPEISEKRFKKIVNHTVGQAVVMVFMQMFLQRRR